MHVIIFLELACFRAFSYHAMFNTACNATAAQPTTALFHVSVCKSLSKTVLRSNCFTGYAYTDWDRTFLQFCADNTYFHVNGKLHLVEE